MEHRLTLGTAERQQLKKVITAYEKDKKWENVPNYLMSAAAMTAAVGVGIGLYKIGQGISMIDIDLEILPNLSDWWNNEVVPEGAATHEGGVSPAEAFVWGAPEYTNYDTGKTYPNPAWVSWFPGGAIPILGSIAGSYINMGIASGAEPFGWGWLTGVVDVSPPPEQAPPPPGTPPEDLPTSLSVPPLNPAVGDFWYNPATAHLHQWDGYTWTDIAEIESW